MENVEQLVRDTSMGPRGKQCQSNGHNSGAHQPIARLTLIRGELWDVTRFHAGQILKIPSDQQHAQTLHKLLRPLGFCCLTALHTDTQRFGLLKGKNEVAFVRVAGAFNSR